MALAKREHSESSAVSCFTVSFALQWDQWDHEWGARVYTTLSNARLLILPRFLRHPCQAARNPLTFTSGRSRPTSLFLFHLLHIRGQRNRAQPGVKENTLGQRDKDREKDVGTKQASLARGRKAYLPRFSFSLPFLPLKDAWKHKGVRHGRLHVPLHRSLRRVPATYRERVLLTDIAQLRCCLEDTDRRPSRRTSLALEIL